MSGAASETVEGFLEQPLVSRFRVRAFLWRGNCAYLVIRESGVAKGVLGISLLGDTSHGNTVGDEYLHSGLADYWCVRL